MGTNGNGSYSYNPDQDIAAIEERIREQYRDDPDKVANLVIRCIALVEHTSNRLIVLEQSHKVPCESHADLAREVRRQGVAIDEIRTRIG